MNDTHDTWTYRYPHPAVAADAVLLSPAGGALSVLLIRRKHEPHRGRWAFPGGFMEIGETLEQAAARELAEETGLSGIVLRQAGAFSRVGRDPRERVITVAFYGFADAGTAILRAGDDAAEAGWFPVSDPPPLAFDHSDILRATSQRIRLDLADPAVASQVVPKWCDPKAVLACLGA